LSTRTAMFLLGCYRNYAGRPDSKRYWHCLSTRKCRTDCPSHSLSSKQGGRCGFGSDRKCMSHGHIRWCCFQVALGRIDLARQLSWLKKLLWLYSFNSFRKRPDLLHNRPDLLHTHLSPLHIRPDQPHSQHLPTWWWSMWWMWMWWTWM
jgi:hypothetical protein